MSTILCPHCGQYHRAGARFCPLTGRPLSQPLSPPPMVVPVGSEGAPGLTGRLPQNYLLKGRYLILRKVGQGGMAAVYQAADTQFSGAQWAIKEMSDAALSAQDRHYAVQSFLREAELLRSLNHPNLPRVVDVFTEGGKHYLVMEFVFGKTLQELLTQRNTPFSEREVLPWALQLCDVLAYLHSQTPKIIFRDLKPGNIMVTPQGQVKLIDFGIARFFKVGKTTDTVALGTPGYAAPEAIHQQTDERSDIYSLCVTLHQLLSLHDPAKSMYRLPPLRELNPLVSIQMERILARGLENERERRWQSAKELRAALAYVANRYEGASTWITPQQSGAPAYTYQVMAGGTSVVTPPHSTPMGNVVPPRPATSSRPTTRLIQAAKQLSPGQLALALGGMALGLFVTAWLFTPLLNAMGVDWNQFPLMALFGALGYAAYPRRGVSFLSHATLTTGLVSAIWTQLPGRAYSAERLLVALLVSGLLLEGWVALLPRVKPKPPAESWRTEVVWLALMGVIGALSFLWALSAGRIPISLTSLVTALLLGALGWFLGDLFRQYLIQRAAGGP